MEQAHHFLSSRSGKVICSILAAIPILIYLVYVMQYAVNIPRMDDYDAILDFLINFRSARAAERFALLFHQHNEHRILLTKLIVAGDYLLTGTVHFKTLIYCGSLLLFGIYACTLYFIRRLIPGLALYAATILSLCLFDINNYENACFAMAGIQNFGIIFLFVASIFFYSRNSNATLAVAVLLQVLVVYTSGNGIIASAFIVLFTLLRGDKKKKIISSLAFVIFAPLYYYHYVPVQSGMSTLSPSKIMPFFLHIVGGHFSNELGIIAGSVLVIVMLLLFPFRKAASDANVSALLCFVGFIAASLLVMAVFRSNQGVDFSYASRYLIYPHLLTGISFSFLLYRFQDRRRIISWSLVLSAFLVFVYIRNYNEGRAGFIRFNDAITRSVFDYPSKERAKAIADEACRQHIYCIDNYRVKR